MGTRRGHSKVMGGGIITASLCLCAALTVWMLRGDRGNAQEKAAPKTEATAIVADLDDIVRLQVINPLKLQPDQMDKLVAALTTAQAEYDKKVNAIGAQVFSPAASEVREMRKKVLSGDAVPKDFDDKIKKLQADFLKQRDGLNTENIQHVAASCRAILTAKQIALATRMERDDWEKEHPDSKNATDNQLFNLYCVDVFISNPRILPLLKELRVAAPK